MGETLILFTLLKYNKIIWLSFIIWIVQIRKGEKSKTL